VPLLLLILCLVVLGAIAVVAAGRGTSMSDAAPDRAPWAELQPGEVDRAKVDALRFSIGFRGYRMDEVDEVLERLVGAIEERDARIAGLQDQLERRARWTE
jgi:DivIVA domain-containing protein